jgi:hypothetical protein
VTAPHAPDARPGKACPPFAFTSSAGDLITSRSVLGKRALAVLFADDPLTADMLGQWEALARQYPNDLALILASLRPDEADSTPFIMTEDADGTLDQAFGVTERPVAYFVRRDGLVTRVARGDDPLLTDPAAFTRLVRALLG